MHSRDTYEDCKQWSMNRYFLSLRSGWKMQIHFNLRFHHSDKAKSIKWNREILILSNSERGPKAAHPPPVFY